MATNNPVETLEALISPKTGEVMYLAYQVEGVGDFRREGGKWVPDFEDSAGQFDDLDIIDLDISKAMPLIDKWDTGEGMSREDVKEYALTEADLESNALEEEPEEL
jgi:hypothetical protein